MATVPDSLRGYLDDAVAFGDVSGFGAAVDYLLEHVPELHHPQSVEVYARMRHDAQLSAILQAYARSTERANWVLDPSGCRDEVAQQLADDLGLPIAGYSDEPDPNDPDAKVQKPTGARRRKFTWGEHLRIGGDLKRTYGHAFFEQAWGEQDGRWRLDVVQERMPQTISALHLNKDGTLKSVEQGGALGSATNAPGSSTVPVLTTADHRLVYYVRNRQGSNYFGESLLRPSYGPWLVKDQVLRVHATSIRRFGMGVPSFEPLPGTQPTPQQEAAADRALAGIKAGEYSYVRTPPGYRLQITGMTGTVPDVVAFINLLDRYMTRSTLTSILDMAVAERGNRSLGETVMDLMVMAQQAEAEAYAAEATSQLVIPLVDANWGEDEAAPQIRVNDVGADKQLTAQDLNWLLEYGGIDPDMPFKAWVRQRYGMPAPDPNYTPPTDNTDTTTGA